FESFRVRSYRADGVDAQPHAWRLGLFLSAIWSLHCARMSSSSSPLTREEFQLRVIDIIRERFPLVKVGPGDGSFSLSVNGAVAPLENLYRVMVLHPDDIKHHVERWAVELLRAAEGSPDQGAAFDDVKDRVLPMIISGSIDDAPEGVVTQSLVEG